MKNLIKSKIPTEHEEQVAFCKWMELQHSTVKFFAIPNGGNRNIVTATKLKAEGVRPGVLDLFIPAWKLFIEMKRRKGGSVSIDQREWIEYLEGCGYTCKVCKGFDEAKLAVIEHLDSL